MTIDLGPDKNLICDTYTYVKLYPKCNCIQPKPNKTAMRIDKLLQRHINTELCFYLNAFVEEPEERESVKNCHVSKDYPSFFDYEASEMDPCIDVRNNSDDLFMSEQDDPQANFDIRCG